MTNLLAAGIRDSEITQNVNLCTFCRLTDPIAPRSSFDEVVFSSENFIAIASLGGFIEGWTLILPREHYLNLRLLPYALREQFTAFYTHVVSSLESLYGPTIAFEHGPSKALRAAGCGVDHAHLHVVPVEVPNLHDLIGLEIPNGLTWSSVKDVFDNAEFDNETDYVYVEDAHGLKAIAYSNDIPSQLVRKVLARALGIRERFDWRQHPECETVAHTITRITAVARINGTR